MIRPFRQRIKSLIAHRPLNVIHVTIPRRIKCLQSVFAVTQQKKIENHLFDLCLEILLKTRLEEILVGKFR